MQGKYEQEFEQSEPFKQELKMKVREILTEQEWRRRKMQMRVCFPATYSCTFHMHMYSNLIVLFVVDVI